MAEVASAYRLRLLAPDDVDARELVVLQTAACDRPAAHDVVREIERGEAEVVGVLRAVGRSSAASTKDRYT
jgi:hypothetical protein